MNDPYDHMEVRDTFQYSKHVIAVCVIDTRDYQTFTVEYRENIAGELKHCGGRPSNDERWPSANDVADDYFDDLGRRVLPKSDWEWTK